MSVDYNIPPPAKEEGTMSFFWPILVLIIGLAISAGYQISTMKEQLASMTQTTEQMQPKIKQAEYEKAKLYRLAADVLQLAATDPNARQIAADYKIQQKSPLPPTAPPGNSPAPAAK